MNFEGFSPGVGVGSMPVTGCLPLMLTCGSSLIKVFLQNLNIDSPD
jgi:hypothetical protein